MTISGNTEENYVVLPNMCETIKVNEDNYYRTWSHT